MAVRPLASVWICSLLFGLSSWISVNGLWLELPVLITRLPEKWALASQISFAIQFSNVIALIYCILNRLNSRFFNEIAATNMQMILGIIACVLLIFKWDYSMWILDGQRSIVLLSSTFLLAILDCLSSVTFLPFMSRLRNVYLIPFLIGEGLSGVLPLMFAIIQNNDINAVASESRSEMMTSWTSLDHQLRFGPSLFFVSLLLTIGLSWTAFLYLLFSQQAGRELITTRPASFKSISIWKRCVGVEPKNEWQSILELKNLEQRRVLLNNQQLLTCEIKRVLDSGRTPKTMKRLVSSNQMLDQDVQADSYLTRWTSLWLQILILISCTVTFGLLPSVQPFSCLPLGQFVLNYSVLLTCLAYPIGCAIGLKFKCKSPNKLTILTLICLPMTAFIFWMAFNSPHLPSMFVSADFSNDTARLNMTHHVLNLTTATNDSWPPSSLDDLPIFDEQGEPPGLQESLKESWQTVRFLINFTLTGERLRLLLGLFMISCWFCLTLTLSYVKTMITVMLNDHGGQDALFKVGVYTQIGSVIGSLFMLMAVNHLQWFHQ